jgi:phosphoglycerate kinase
MNSKIKSLYSIKIKGKTVFLRCDLNSSIIAERVALSSRIREHAKTIYFLSEEETKTVILSHQGRKGRNDFVDLHRHAKLIKKLIDKPVKFIKWNEDYIKAINEMNNGEIILLDNTRFLKEEEQETTPQNHSQNGFIKKLAKINNSIFVQDSLSVCHRSHASVIGLACCMPAFVGPVLQRDLDALEKINEIKDSKTMILGGAKIKDSIKIIDKCLTKKYTDKILLGGLLGEVFLKAKGIKFGAKDKFLEEKKFTEFVPSAKKLLEKFNEKIILPIDLGAENGKRTEIKVKNLPTELMIYDIGWETIEKYKKIIKKSKLTVFNGPMGMFERNGFALGTKKILESIAFSRTYSIVGGGDTEKAIMNFGLMPQDFNQLSLAGKALLSYLAGETLPGLEILKK